MNTKFVRYDVFHQEPESKESLLTEMTYNTIIYCTSANK